MSELALRSESFALIRDLEEAGALSPTHLDLSTHPDLDYETCESLAAFLGQINHASRWWIADLLRFVEAQHGEAVAQVADATGLAPQTIENICSVGNRVPPKRRKASLSFSCHAEVASLAPSEQTNWLILCEQNRWTKAELRAQIQAEKAQENGRVLPPAVLNPRQAWETVWHSSRRVVGDSFLVPAEPFLALRDAFDA